MRFSRPAMVPDVLLALELSARAGPSGKPKLDMLDVCAFCCKFCGDSADRPRSDVYTLHVCACFFGLIAIEVMSWPLTHLLGNHAFHLDACSDSTHSVLCLLCIRPQAPTLPGGPGPRYMSPPRGASPVHPLGRSPSRSGRSPMRSGFDNGPPGRSPGRSGRSPNRSGRSPGRGGFDKGPSEAGPQHPGRGPYSRLSPAPSRHEKTIWIGQVIPW